MIRAAGAVVWRGEEADPEIVLVHRPAYDDWSLPKGKLRNGEHVIAAALREVREETGLGVVLGRALPPVHYLKDGRLKRVDYWLARDPGDGPDPGEEGGEGIGTGIDEEVDEVVWLPIEEAVRRLTYQWDRHLLRAVGAAPLTTTPLIFLRHALAGSRQEWKGDDDHRPLDERGRTQAEILATVLGAYRPERLVSSHSRRCTQTIGPYAERRGLEVRREKALSESGYAPARRNAWCASRSPRRRRRCCAATARCCPRCWAWRVRRCTGRGPPTSPSPRAASPSSITRPVGWSRWSAT